MQNWDNKMIYIHKAQRRLKEILLVQVIKESADQIELKLMIPWRDYPRDYSFMIQKSTFQETYEEAVPLTDYAIIIKQDDLSEDQVNKIKSSFQEMLKAPGKLKYTLDKT
jgi:TRAP-type uncharacterized transport system substrate-binding protein